MKASFKLISTLLIILLTVLLVAILVSYYNAPIDVDDYNIENFANTNQEINKVISENISGEIITNIDMVPLASGEVSGERDENKIISSDKLVSDKKDNDKKNEVKDEKKDDKKTQVIITSEDTMTNKEKREILTELDNTLMELLEVVDKVQTIDESRLVTDESGVQE